MSLTEVYRAQSIIERDAIVAALRDNDIEVFSPERSISRKVTENTVDLSHGGYSAFFDGFKILVPEQSVEAANEVIRKIQDVAKEYEISAVRPATEIQKIGRSKWFWRVVLLFHLASILFYYLFGQRY